MAIMMDTIKKTVDIISANWLVLFMPVLVIEGIERLLPLQFLPLFFVVKGTWYFMLMNATWKALKKPIGLADYSMPLARLGRLWLLALGVLLFLTIAFVVNLFGGLALGLHDTIRTVLFWMQAGFAAYFLSYVLCLFIHMSVYSDSIMQSAYRSFEAIKNNLGLFYWTMIVMVAFAVCLGGIIVFSHSKVVEFLLSVIGPVISATLWVATYDKMLKNQK